MYGFWYSVKENYSFTGKELRELFWTGLAFAFILTAYYAGFLYKQIILEDTLGLFIALLICTIVALYLHVALQKIVGIRLGYNVTYTYWLNGILICLFLSFLTFGMIPLVSMLILPGAVTLEHLPKLRLGKFRYGTNAKDIARVGLAGPLAHILIVMVLGVFYLATRSDNSGILFKIITMNLLLLIYSMLPLPKIDSPAKMDSASDGLGIFFFSRSIYVLCFATVVFYALLIWIANIFSFITAFLLGIIMTIVYIVTVDQKN
jgi:hypothetical protein